MTSVTKETPDKGRDIFAARHIGRGERIVHADLREIKTYALAELEPAVGG